MIVTFWITAWLIFALTACFISFYVFKRKFLSESIETILAGFKTALNDCGFHLKKTTKLKSFKWVVVKDEEDVCDDCLLRTQWPAMDVGEWIQAGLPDPKEPLRPCCGDCQCDLIPVKKQKSPHKQTDS